VGARCSLAGEELSDHEPYRYHLQATYHVRGASSRCNSSERVKEDGAPPRVVRTKVSDVPRQARTGVWYSR